MEAWRRRHSRLRLVERVGFLVYICFLSGTVYVRANSSYFLFWVFSVGGVSLLLLVRCNWSPGKTHFRNDLLCIEPPVAKRPRDASYLSVVGFNSTKRRVKSFNVSYIGYRFIIACSWMRCSVVFGVTLRLLVINISSSSPTINTAAYYQRCVVTCETVAVVHRRLYWQHLACCSANSRH